MDAPLTETGKRALAKLLRCGVNEVRLGKCPACQNLFYFAATKPHTFCSRACLRKFRRFAESRQAAALSRAFFPPCPPPTTLPDLAPEPSAPPKPNPRDALDRAIMQVVVENETLIRQNDGKIANKFLWDAIQKKIGGEINDNLYGRACARLRLPVTRLRGQKAKRIDEKTLNRFKTTLGVAPTNPVPPTTPPLAANPNPTKLTTPTAPNPNPPKAAPALPRSTRPAPAKPAPATPLPALSPSPSATPAAPSLPTTTPRPLPKPKPRPLSQAANPTPALTTPKPAVAPKKPPSPLRPVKTSPKTPDEGPLPSDPPWLTHDGSFWFCDKFGLRSFRKPCLAPSYRCFFLNCPNAFGHSPDPPLTPACD